MNENLRASGFIATGLPKLCFGIGIFSGLGAIWFFLQDRHHFFFSYLTVFLFFATLSLGGLFLVLIHHLTRAGWSVVVRRIAEHFMKNIGVVAILFIPVLLGIHELYHWSHAHEVLHDPILQKKAGYLNTPFFILRSGVYLAVWAFLAWIFFKKSVEQDTSDLPQNTLNLQTVSTFGTLLFALSITFASFDWIMSLDPHWYSTIFGVYVFGGSVVAALSAVSLFALILRRQGILKNVISIDHYQDLGKLLYGFVVFWTYIGFSQFFLIWYADIPEETLWYIHRAEGNWKTLSIVLILGHFVVPFVLFMSRHMKRNLKVHAAMVCWMLGMHFLDMYWLVMPTVLKKGPHFSIGDIVIFLAVGGIYLGVLFRRASQYALIPSGDPRLKESMEFHNT